MFDKKNYPNCPNYFSRKDEQLIIDPVSENILHPISQKIDLKIAF